MKRNYKKGAALAEVLVAVFIFSVILMVLISANNLYLKSASSNISSAQAAYLAEEGIEAIHTIRDRSWTSFYALSTTTDLYLYFSATSSSWNLSSSATSTGIFTRKIRIYPVLRDNTSHQISTSTINTTNDINTRYASSSVSWLDGGKTKSNSLTAYFSNLEN